VSVAFDPFEAGFAESPYDQYQRIRSADPVHESELLCGWMLTRYDDVAKCLKLGDISSVIDNATPTAITSDEISRRTDMGHEAMPIVLTDPPDHGRLRRLLAQPFGAGAIRKLRTMVERRVGETLDAVIDARGDEGTFDVIGDFAYPLPVAVFCEMLGLPQESEAEFRRWTSSVARSLDPMIDTEERDLLQLDSEAMRDYLGSQVQAKRANPGDDILTQLVEATYEGDRLTEAELIAQLQTLYVAGHEPTTALVGNGLLALFAHPEQLDALWADRGLVHNAVLEMLRYDGPNQFVRRVAMADIDFGGTQVPAGAVLYPCVGAANRDPARWGDTHDQLDIARPDAKDHLQFGAGIHSCLGGHLARLQAEVVFEAMIDRFASVAPAGDEAWSERMVLRGLQSLPISYRLR